jgi:hypothetical protein|tara:strand:+ start:520 stop:669 length:150 start_codon:yes stop_codon:yes gene_type:complete
MKGKKQAGKGDKPRNCFSNGYKSNYEQIDWGNNKCVSVSNVKKNSPKQN